MRLQGKLIIANIGLVLFSAGVLTASALFLFGRFQNDSLQIMETKLEDEAKTALLQRCQDDRKRLSALIESVEKDIARLASSFNLQNYFLAKKAENESWNKLVREESAAIVKSFIALCQNQDSNIRMRLRHNMAVCQNIVDRYGKPRLLGEEAAWRAINQITLEEREVRLPAMAFGDLKIMPNDDYETPSALVDEVVTLVGGSCTVFQRFDEEGNMLRIATTVRNKDGRRAIGTFIPVKNKDGSPNPVIQEVLAGKTYFGRAFVVDKWLQTAYAPLTDNAGRIIGMLYVGLSEIEDSNLLWFTRSIRIGQSGGIVILDTNGLICAHADRSKIGKPISDDIAASPWAIALRHRDEAEIKFHDFIENGRKGYLVYGWFAPWNWVICGYGYWDESTGEITNLALDLLEKELLLAHNMSRMQTSQGDAPAYLHMILYDETGRGIIKIEGGKANRNIAEDGKRYAWFQEVLTRKEGQVYIGTPENISKDRLAVIFAAPVYSNKKVQGAIALAFDWAAVVHMVGEGRYGKNGYAYLVTDSGVLAAHPKYRLADAINISDPKHGQDFARIVKERIMKGEEGYARYEFEGVDKLVAYSPLYIGKHRYSLAATLPLADMTGVVMDLRGRIDENSRQLYVNSLSVAAALAIAGAVFGFLFSKRISSAIGLVVTAAKRLADGDIRYAGARDKEMRRLLQRDDELGELGKAFDALALAQENKSEEARRIAAGDLSQDASVASQEDILGQAFMAMVYRLRELLGTIQATISQVDSGANQIAAAAQSLSQGATEQAASLEEISSSMTEIGTQARQNADNARQAKELGGETRRLAEKGAEEAREMGGAMNEIKEASRHIAKIVKMIDEIAFQTNLLALNAAVEAARAGRHGKGFAVVADEVRSLAQRSAKAAKETSELIEGIAQKITNGTAVADKLGSSLAAIAQQAIKTAVLIDEIAAASNEQAQGIAQVSQGLQQIDQVTQQNTANAEETAAAAQELASQASALRELAARFRLRQKSEEVTSVSLLKTDSPQYGLAKANCPALPASGSIAAAADKSEKSPSGHQHRELIRWDDSFATGISSFDNQHRKLIELVNRLYAALGDGKGNAVLGGILDELVSYTQEHFAAEERMMQLYRYPELESHCQAHAGLVARVQDFMMRFRNGGVSLSVDVMSFLKSWLIDHIQKIDRRYGPFLRQKGVG